MFLILFFRSFKILNSVTSFLHLSECNWTRTYNHLVRKQTLNHLAKWLSCVMSTYLYGAFDYVFIMSHMFFRVPWHLGIHYRVWIHSEMGMRHDKNIQSILECLSMILLEYVQKSNCLIQYFELHVFYVIWVSVMTITSNWIFVDCSKFWSSSEFLLSEQKLIWKKTVTFL